ncbi:MAG: N-acetyltransferase [Nitrososphaerales archaeon]
MKTDILIRKAEMKDAERIADFNILMARETEGKELDKSIVLEGVKAVINDSHKGFYLVAEKTSNSKEIVGQLMVTFEWSDWRNKCFWWIQSAYVDKRFRKRGIFSRLYEHIVKMANLRSDVSGLRLYVEKYNETAKQVYESLGFMKTSYEIYQIRF